MIDPAYFGIAQEMARMDRDWMRTLAGGSMQDEMLRQLNDLGTAGLQAAQIGELLAIQSDHLTDALFSTPFDGLRQHAIDIGFEQAARQSFADIGSSAFVVQSLVDQIQTAATAAAQIHSLAPTFEVGSFIQSLPDMGNVETLLERLVSDEGEAALEEGGFGFALHLLPQRYVATMAWITPGIRPAVVTRKLLAHTRTGEFRSELESTICQSKALQRRWRIIDRALIAHCAGDYILSIPVLLAQVEGAIADAMLLKNLITVRGGKLLRKGPDGKLKLDRNGDPIVVRGVKQLLQGDPLKNHPLMHLAAEEISEKLADERNFILHGRKTNYDKGGMSLRSLLILLSVAPDIAAFEAGEFDTE